MGPTANPTPYPTTANPTPYPTTTNPTSSPTAAVTAAPSMAPADCEDDENFRYKNKKNKNCKWVGKGVEKKVKSKCKKKHDEIPVYEWCPTTCGKVGLGECKAYFYVFFILNYYFFYVRLAAASILKKTKLILGLHINF